MQFILNLLNWNKCFLCSNCTSSKTRKITESKKNKKIMITKREKNGRKVNGEYFTNRTGNERNKQCPNWLVGSTSFMMLQDAVLWHHLLFVDLQHHLWRWFLFAQKIIFLFLLCYGEHWNSKTYKIKREDCKTILILILWISTMNYITLWIF